MDLTKIIILLVWNLIVFLIFGADKYAAVHGNRRIPEIKLIEISFIMGGFGGLIGMFAFRHKTKHTKFMVLVPIFAFVQALLIFAYYKQG